MKRRNLVVFASFMMLVFLAGCGKIPQEQIDAAKLAVESARVAEADVYVPVEYAALQNEMKTAMTAIEAENSKTFKNFKDEKIQLEAILASAATVQENAGVAKEQVKVEAEELFIEISNLMAANKELMLKAPKGKEGAAVLEEMRNELMVIEASVAEANALLQQGKFMAARDKVKAAIVNVTSINTELEEAIAKVKRK